MLIGNPDKFSILFEVVKEWNIDERFKNGVLFLSVNSNLFPKEIVTATLDREIKILKDALINITVNERLYNLPKDKAFIEIYKITFPEDFNLANDYSFNITPDSLLDNNCFIFALSNGKYIRILASQLQYIIEESCHELNNINICETFIDTYEINKMISNLDMFSFK